MKYVVMGVAFALVAGTPASGQQTAPATPGTASDQSAVQTKAASKKKVCRRVEVTGSIMRESICKTADQWAAEDQAAKNEAEDRIQASRRSGWQNQ